MKKRGGRRKVTPETVRRMKELRGIGLTYKEVAKRLDLSVMTVYNYLKGKERVGFLQRLKRKLGSR